MISNVSSYAASAYSLSRLDKKPNAIVKTFQLKTDTVEQAKISRPQPVSTGAATGAQATSRVEALTPPPGPHINKAEAGEAVVAEPVVPGAHPALSAGKPDTFNPQLVKALRIVFDAIEATGNGDGLVTKDELSAIFDKIGANLEQFGLDAKQFADMRERVSTIFSNADRDGNGVSQKEFVVSIAEDPYILDLLSVFNFYGILA